MGSVLLGDLNSFNNKKPDHWLIFVTLRSLHDTLVQHPIVRLRINLLWRNGIHVEMCFWLFAGVYEIVEFLLGPFRHVSGKYGWYLYIKGLGCGMTEVLFSATVVGCTSLGRFPYIHMGRGIIDGADANIGTCGRRRITTLSRQVTEHTVSLARRTVTYFDLNSSLWIILSSVEGYSFRFRHSEFLFYPVKAGPCEWRWGVRRGPHIL